MKLITLILIGFIFAGISAYGETHIYGDIEEDEVWEWEYHPYYIHNSISILSGVTVTVEEDVDVLFYSDVFLTVDGEFDAIGIQDHEIEFGLAGVDLTWGGIIFSNDEVCSIDYCTLNESEDGIVVDLNTAAVSIVCRRNLSDTFAV